MPNKAKTPDAGEKHDKSWAEDRHRKQAGQGENIRQQQADDPARRQQGGWQSDEELRKEQRREVGEARDRDYNPDGERPIDRR